MKWRHVMKVNKFDIFLLNKVNKIGCQSYGTLTIRKCPQIKNFKNSNRDGNKQFLKDYLFYHIHYLNISLNYISKNHN